MIKSYLIYLQESNKEIRVIKDSFSFKALFFGPLWSAYHALWFVTIILLLVMLFLQEAILSNYIDNFYYMVIYVLMMVYLGFEASDILQKRMRDEGYVLKDVVLARSFLEAETVFMRSIS